MQKRQPLGPLARTQVGAFQALGDGGLVGQASACVGQQGNRPLGVAEPVVVDLGGLEQKLAPLGRPGGGVAQRGQFLGDGAIVAVGQQDAADLGPRRGVGGLHAMGLAPGGESVGGAAHALLEEARDLGLHGIVRRLLLALPQE